ncbi:hypothetical protein NQ314_007884 [Rhamnusium bicolor]|uniref:Uncharacterized protein n=1 Tax=Rhamnusium bicolor TaxID=1586634 RepID=A0AAV8YHB0_9CUCU|nr:hypothetical protein NQ314_007884 [Rhamnusium bicolor]
METVLVLTEGLKLSNELLIASTLELTDCGKDELIKGLEYVLSDESSDVLIEGSAWLYVGIWDNGSTSSTNCD